LERSLELPGSGRESIGSGAAERALFLGLCAGLLAYWALQYHPFVLPTNDYPSFERTARSLAALELPASFQRMPVYPGLMAAVAPLVPERHPYLHAALGLNLAFAIWTVALVFRLASRAFGRGALLPALLLACTTQLHGMALQPLVEPSLGFFVVLAFALFEERSPWQYAAAWAAALSRYEAALLIPVLLVANLASEGRPFRHLALAALASTGVLGWAALGWLHGSGGATYLDLMQGMGFRPAPDFFERSFKEPFRGWYREPGEGLAVFLLAVGAPLAIGIGAGVREFRRLALALLAFFALSVGLIVVFGINKARYVYPSAWIPIFFFSLGALRLQGIGARLLARAPAPLAAATAVLAGGLALFSARRFALRIAALPAAQPAWLDLAFAVFCLALLVGLLASLAPRRGRLAFAASGLALLALLVPQIGGGLHAKRKEFFKIYYNNWSSWLAGEWLEKHLAAGELAVAVSPSHVVHGTALAENRVLGYSGMRAETTEDLAREMRDRHVRYAVYTWRKTPDTPSDEYYRKKMKAYLGEAFRGGAPVPGFEHVATLALPPELGRDPVQVYELAGDGGG
jgi:hypothetical protein